MSEMTIDTAAAAEKQAAYEQQRAEARAATRARAEAQTAKQQEKVMESTSMCAKTGRDCPVPAVCKDRGCAAVGGPVAVNVVCPQHGGVCGSPHICEDGGCFLLEPEAEQIAAEAKTAGMIVDGGTYPDDNPKTAIGITKPSTSRIPSVALLQLGAVMALGAKKYGPFNWREKRVTTSVYADAIMRHFLAYLDGETADPESGEHPLAHVMACCSIIIDAESLGTLNDDRASVKGAAPLWIAEHSRGAGS